MGQIRHISVNHFTIPTITALRELIGQLTEVPYDNTKAQNKDFVRVRLRFDVYKPLRMSKVINLSKGEATTVLFDYERIQKRCYTCQRLTHEQEVCPLLIKKARHGFGKKIYRWSFATHHN